MILEDGTCSVDLSNITYPSKKVETPYQHSFLFSLESYSYKGFSDIDSLFYDAVTAYVDKYTYESTLS